MTAIQKPAAKGNYATGRAQRISRITFHHIVGDAPAAIARFQTPGVQVSATYVIGSDGTLYQCVSENDTAYCDGNSDSNARTISIEHAGGLPSVPYTDAMYATSIALVADLIKRYGITDFKRHSEVIDKSVYPGGTACPGGLDVERIVNGAKGENMAFMDAVIATDEDEHNVFIAWVGRARLPQEVGRYIGWKVRDAWPNIAGNQNRLDIDVMIKGYYANNAQIPTGKDPEVVVNGTPYGPK